MQCSAEAVGNLHQITAQRETGEGEENILHRGLDEGRSRRLLRQISALVTFFPCVTRPHREVRSSIAAPPGPN